MNSIRIFFHFSKYICVCIQEEWRIIMPPIQCLFLRIQPTADVRLRFKSNGEDYPPNIPHHISQILELQLVSIFH
jgi:hypothetical protein